MSFPIPCAICKRTKPSITHELYSIVSAPCGHVYCYECGVRVYHHIRIQPKREHTIPNCPYPECERPVTNVMMVENQPTAEKVKVIIREHTQYPSRWERYVNSPIIYREQGMLDILKDITFFRCQGCNYFSHDSIANVCDYSRGQFRVYQKHLTLKHNQEMCDACFFTLKLLPCEYEAYDSAEMRRHRHLPNEVGQAAIIVRHRECRQCEPDPTWHFDQTALDEHVARMHEGQPDPSASDNDPTGLLQLSTIGRAAPRIFNGRILFE